jgi:hypothetical protein
MHYNRLLYKLRRVIYKPMLKLVILDLFFFLVSIGAFFVTKGYAIEFFVFRYSIPLAFVTTVWLLVGYTFKKYRGLHHNRYRDSSFQVFATTLLTLVIVSSNFVLIYVMCIISYLKITKSLPRKIMAFLTLGILLFSLSTSGLKLLYPLGVMTICYLFYRNRSNNFMI